MLLFDPKMKAVARFAATAFLLYIAWFAFYEFYLMKEARFISELISFETEVAGKFLKALNLKDNFSGAGNLIICNGKRLLRVGEECSGIVLFALFSGFVICYPGKWTTKLWYIPLGIFIIFLLNILRIALLSLNFKYYHSSFSFNHHVTFTYTVYAFIFLLWMIWVNKFGNVSSKHQK